MKFRRKPVKRDVVDALLDEKSGIYQVLHSDGTLDTSPRDEFEALYAPARLVRAPKEKPKRKARGSGASAQGAAALSARVGDA